MGEFIARDFVWVFFMSSENWSDHLELLSILGFLKG